MSTGSVTISPGTYRIAGPEDVAAIRELVRAAYQRWVPVIGREPLPMVANYHEAVRNHSINLVEAEGTIVALIETMVRDDHLWIENVAVHPEKQGKGIGRNLLSHAEILAQQAGRNEVRLLTNGAFEVNIRLYLSVGYRITETQDFRGGTAVYMAKTLA